MCVHVYIKYRPYTFMHARTHTYTHTHMYVCMYVCMYVYKLNRVRTYTHIHTLILANRPTQRQMNINK